MVVALEIVPLSDSLDMYGAPDRSSAYSLSGHVSISLHSTSSFFDKKRRPIRTTLQSLTLTFEGQSELLTQELGYSPFRICSVTRELLQGEPIELNNEGFEDSDEPCAWNAVFNLPVPGWLPQTSAFGDSLHGSAGISYALYATATCVNIDEDARTRSIFSFATFCTPFASKTRLVKAPLCPIIVNRYMVPPVITSTSSSRSLFNTTLFHARTNLDPKIAANGKPLVPKHILEKIRVYLRIPEHVSIEDDSEIPFTLKLCAEGLTDEDCARLTMSGFHGELEQTEKYRSSVTSQYQRAFPVPQRASQPPHLPLLNPHPLQSFYEVGLGVDPLVNQTIERTFSVLGPKFSGEFHIAGNQYIFAATPGTSGARRAFTVESALPFSTGPRDSKVTGALGHRMLRPSSEGPHLSVRHRLHLTLTCAWDGGEPETLTFNVPVSFVNTPSAPGGCNNTPTASTEALACSEEAAPLLQKPVACSTQLALRAPPAYSQLFWSNGERRVEDGLPQYEPPRDLLQ